MMAENRIVTVKDGAKLEFVLSEERIIEFLKMVSQWYEQMVTLSSVKSIRMNIYSHYFTNVTDSSTSVRWHHRHRNRIRHRRRIRRIRPPGSFRLRQILRRIRHYSRPDDSPDPSQ